jgi:hypothetical protein
MKRLLMEHMARQLERDEWPCHICTMVDFNNFDDDIIYVSGTYLIYH